MAELLINIGDIKKIKTNYTEFSGVVIEKNNNKISIMDITGAITGLYFQEIVDITSVRLSSEVRDRLEKIGKLAKEKEKISKEEEKLRMQKRELDNKIGKQREYYMNSIGVMNENAFAEELIKTLEIKYGELLMSQYRVNIYPTMERIQITLQKEMGIAKYPRIEEYSYLYREYDGNIMVNDDDKNYKLTIERCKNKGREIRLVGKKINGFETYENRGLYMGDKSLSYVHTIDINTKYNRLDKKLLREVFKIFF